MPRVDPVILSLAAWSLVLMPGCYFEKSRYSVTTGGKTYEVTYEAQIFASDVQSDHFDASEIQLRRLSNQPAPPSGVDPARITTIWLLATRIVDAQEFMKTADRVEGMIADLQSAIAIKKNDNDAAKRATSAARVFGAGYAEALSRLESKKAEALARDDSERALLLEAASLVLNANVPNEKLLNLHVSDPAQALAAIDSIVESAEKGDRANLEASVTPFLH